MSIKRGFSDSEPVGRQARARADRRDSHVGAMGYGTLACPSCDAPVSPGPGPRSPSDALACPVCDHAGRIRDFLSMAAPVRPARVEVRLVAGPRWAVRR
ncbi:hypothetical protein [Patulibacter minatonensis]|uniref:hypothetical protein n=1 Tax=Patulibacter minatonensis TaxID=298163 RepID=UPI0004790493|nr:hypothetical protein [Patulibacter minatonensis]